MLVLSRKEEESIIINDNIEIKIVSLRQDQVKIGIVAPRSVKIYRKELYDNIQRENIEAANISHKFDELKNVMDKKIK